MQVHHRGTEVRLTKRGRYYQAVWTEDGQRQRKSTGASDPEAAIAAAKAMVEKRLRQSTEMRLSDALDKIWRERWQYQASTHRVTYFKDAIELWGDVRLADVTRDMLLHLRRHFEATGISEKTVNRRMQSIMSVFRAAHYEWDVLDTAPPRIKLTKEKPGRYRYLSDDEIRRLFDVVDDDYRLVFRFLLETGVRPGKELYGVTWSMIDQQYERLVLPGDITKTDYARTVPLDSELLDALLATRGDAGRNDPVFPWLTKAILRREWNKVRIRMELEDDPEFVPYTLRHTCATRLVNAGVPTSTVQKWLGHRNITTTEHYLNQAAADLDQYRALASVSKIVSDCVKKG